MIDNKKRGGRKSKIDELKSSIEAMQVYLFKVKQHEFYRVVGVIAKSKIFADSKIREEFPIEEIEYYTSGGSLLLTN